MNALEFYKYINSNNIEFHWHHNDSTNERDVIFFPYYFQIKELSELLSTSDFDDEGIKCVMKQGYFAFWASDILDAHGIELTEIFGDDPE